MKGTYHGEKKREEFSIEEFTLQIKRKAMGFTSAGLAIFIMTFSYYVIGMEDHSTGRTNPGQQALSEEKSDTSEDTNTSDQNIITDKPSQSDTTDSKEATKPSENGISQAEASSSTNTSTNHRSSDLVAIVDPSEELPPVYEKDKLPPVNENQKPGKVCYKWRHPGFLEKLDPCNLKDKIRTPERKTNKILEEIIPQDKIKNKLKLPEKQSENRHNENS